jgi:hypothetical protein
VVEFEPAIKSLNAEKADFVTVDGLAVSIHSTGYITTDFDFCYLRTKKNLKKIVATFARFKPHPRGFPEDLPFVWYEQTLQNGTNFTLKTEIGDIDLLGEVSGIGSFAAVEKESILIMIYDCEVKILTLDGLIKAKRAAGRAKDLLVLPELEALREVLIEGGEK